MDTIHKPFRRIAVAAHPNVEEASGLAEEISSHLAQQGLPEYHGSLNDPELQKRVQAGEFDLLIALGGDGTMLRAGHLCAPVDVPILPKLPWANDSSRCIFMKIEIKILNVLFVENPDTG